MITVVLLAAFAAGCRMPSTVDTSAEFLPPTEVPPPTVTPLPATPAPPKQGDCTDVLSYVDDITIPDGTVVTAGVSIDKRWQIRNNGTCDWAEGYTLRRTSGDALGADESQPLNQTRSGSTDVLQVILTAPDTPGNYRTSWRAYNAGGEPFGDLIFIDFVVE